MKPDVPLDKCLHFAKWSILGCMCTNISAIVVYS